MLNHSKFVLPSLVIAMVLAMACGSVAEPGAAATQGRAPSAGVTTQATVTPVSHTEQPVSAAQGATLADMPAPTAVGGGQSAASASPAAAKPVVTMASVVPEESPVTPVDLPAVGTSAGDLSPGYTLLLADGSTVSSKDLTRAGKPVFLMFTATW